jgi:hypothetical protein
MALSSQIRDPYRGAGARCAAETCQSPCAMDQRSALPAIPLRTENMGHTVHTLCQLAHSLGAPAARRQLLSDQKSDRTGLDVLRILTGPTSFRGAITCRTGENFTGLGTIQLCLHSEAVTLGFNRRSSNGFCPG